MLKRWLNCFLVTAFHVLLSMCAGFICFTHTEMYHNFLLRSKYRCINQYTAHKLNQIHTCTHALTYTHTCKHIHLHAHTADTHFFCFYFAFIVIIRVLFIITHFSLPSHLCHNIICIWIGILYNMGWCFKYAHWVNRLFLHCILLYVLSSYFSARKLFVHRAKIKLRLKLTVKVETWGNKRWKSLLRTAPLH